MEKNSLKSYNIGNSDLGIQLTLRNLRMKKSILPRRYIRLVFKVLQGRFILEYRFSNSI